MKFLLVEPSYMDKFEQQNGKNNFSNFFNEPNEFEKKGTCSNCKYCDCCPIRDSQPFNEAIRYCNYWRPIINEIFY